MTGAIAQRMETLTETQLGARLAERRRELGIEQKEAALMCGTTQPTFHRWEHGRAPDEKFLIARFLGISRAEVVLLRSNEDPTEFVAGQIENLAEVLIELRFKPGDVGFELPHLLLKFC